MASLDSDVLGERRRIEANQCQEDVLVIKGVEKTYRSALGVPLHKAVQGLYVGVQRGECFGLLGVNGAGMLVKFADLLPVFLVIGFFRKKHNFQHVDRGLVD